MSKQHNNNTDVVEGQTVMLESEKVGRVVGMVEAILDDVLLVTVQYGAKEGTSILTRKSEVEEMPSDEEFRARIKKILLFARSNVIIGYINTIYAVSDADVYATMEPGEIVDDFLAWWGSDETTSGMYK